MTTPRSKSPSATSGKLPRRVLVANRGEIAVRVIRTLRELGIESVAVYSDADQDGLHRHLADFAVRLPGVSSQETYLRGDRIVAAARAAQADAIHPGYGFLSENSAFARAVHEAGLTFIGPPADVMELLGNKVRARNLMQDAGIPVVPGVREPLRDAADLARHAANLGYPLILKAAGGGGGRGMRVVRKKEELDAAFAACTREAQAYFGSAEVFCERYIENPRHIEFQIFCDQHGHGVHFFERDCSIQRRHQKLIEEAPSLYLSDEQRRRIGEQAVSAARAAGYVGAGTVEFICESPDRTYFMEMNTRIQVEHPVTEVITGTDLIALQLHIAAGLPLPMSQAEIPMRGWAIEARINAEDPSQDFAPAPGYIHKLHLPAGPFVRVDSHIYAGYRVPDAYDSLLAKVIAWGETRDEAIRRLQRALGELRLEGMPTTAPFHEAVLAHPDFVAGRFTTRFLEEQPTLLADHDGEVGPETRGMMAAAAALLATSNVAAPVSDPVPTSTRWRQIARLEGQR